MKVYIERITQCIAVRKNENIQIPHVNSNAFMTYWSVFKEIISYKSVSQLQLENFQTDALFIW